MFLLFPVGYAKAPTAPVHKWTRQELIQYAENEAVKAHISPERVVKVISCESQWNPSAKGDSDRSIGLVQIHLPSHPEITEKQALNPIFSIDFLISEWVKGRQSKWTCWKIYFS
mgnify:CR=1 FL=1